MPYRASVIGCGRVAWLLENDPLEAKPCTHMGAYEELKKSGLVEVVAASDTDPERLTAFALKYGITAAYDDYKEMLFREHPEIVSICAYAPQRYRMVMDSIEAGVKGIWCEKAFATSLEEGYRMMEECRRKGVSLIVSHLRRWSPEYNKAKEIIDSGGIGKLQSVVCHFSGSLIHTGTHAFDVLRWFCGSPEWVEGWLEKRQSKNFSWDGGEDAGGRAFIQFGNDVYATVHAESRHYFFFEFDIIGSRGRIRIGNNGVLEYYVPKDSRYYTGFKELHAEKFPEHENKNIWVEALGCLIGCMENNRENPSGPQEGTGALELALAAHESAGFGGKRVYLPLEKIDLKVRSR